MSGSKHFKALLGEKSCRGIKHNQQDSLSKFERFLSPNVNEKLFLGVVLFTDCCNLYSLKPKLIRCLFSCC